MDLYARPQDVDDVSAEPSLAWLDIEADAEADTLLRIAHAMTLLNQVPKRFHWDVDMAGGVSIAAAVLVRASQARTLARRLGQLWQVRRLLVTHAGKCLHWEEGGELDAPGATFTMDTSAIPEPGDTP